MLLTCPIFNQDIPTTNNTLPLIPITAPLGAARPVDVRSESRNMPNVQTVARKISREFPLSLDHRKLHCLLQRDCVLIRPVVTADPLAT